MRIVIFIFLPILTASSQSQSIVHSRIKKHQPFGWVKYQDKKSYTLYCNVNDNCDFEADFADFNFVDGTLFGVEY